MSLLPSTAVKHYWSLSYNLADTHTYAHTISQRDRGQHALQLLPATLPRYSLFHWEWEREGEEEEDKKQQQDTVSLYLLTSLHFFFLEETHHQRACSGSPVSSRPDWAEISSFALRVNKFVARGSTDVVDKHELA